jgi:hypothetical protein
MRRIELDGEEPWEGSQVTGENQAFAGIKEDIETKTITNYSSSKCNRST